MKLLTAILFCALLAMLCGGCAHVVSFINNPFGLP
jgi:hypothetical protein